MSPLSPISDDELLCSFQSGDDSSFELIYLRYWGILYRHARKMMQDDDGAKDIVQEVFATLWLKRNDPTAAPIPTPLAAFLYTVTRNKILDLIKHAKIKANYLDSLHPEEMQCALLPDSETIANELARQIEKEVQALPTKMREIFELSRKAHKTHKEISEELNISDKTVKKQVSNALKILKSKLNILFSLL
jgi:RNA polymerase sigma-70 factor (family 1)